MSDERTGSDADPGAGPPNPFSREGSAADDALGANPSPAAPEPAGPSAATYPGPGPGSEPTAPPTSWPTYPPTDVPPPDAGPGSTPYPTAPYPYGPPSANPAGQPAPPSFDAQPTGPYGSPEPSPGYPQPPAAPYAPAPYASAPYASAPPSYGSNPYEVNTYQPSYAGYSAYGVPAIPHPKSNPALIFGIVGLALALSCGIGGLLGIGGIINGRAARAEIDADPQRYTGRSTASAGFGLGIASVVIAGLVIVAFLIALAAGAFSD